MRKYSLQRSGRIPQRPRMAFMVVLVYLLVPPTTTGVNAFVPSHTFLTSKPRVGSTQSALNSQTERRGRHSGTQKRPKRGSRPNSNKNKKKIDKQTSKRYRLDREAAARRPRPVLTHYDANTAPRINQERLQHDTIDCEHFDVCSGCSVQSKVGSNIPTIQSAKSYFSSPWIRSCMLRPPSSTKTSEDFYKVVIPSPLTSWRTQAKLVAAPQSSAWSNGIHFGLYQSRSHQVVAIPNCAVHHPSINRGIAVLQQATSKIHLSAYDEERREGALRYVQLQVERTTGKLCVTLVWNAETLKQTQPQVSRLVKQLQQLDPDLWHSIWVNCNDGMGNNILARNPSRWHRVFGPEFLREPLPVGDKGWLYFTPMTFRQGNLDGFDILANDVARRVPVNAKVCELYAGVGLLGLTALSFYEGGLQWLRCSDENPSNARCFQRAVESLPPEWVGRGRNENNRKKPQQHQEEELTIAQLMARMESGDAVQSQPPKGSVETTSYLVASATRALRSGQALGANVIIVDPPRKGLEPEVLDELCKPIDRHQDTVDDISMLTVEDDMARWTNDARTLIYVSCGFEALARDAERLLTSKGAGWKLESATGYILFPGSDHVETLCVFQRD